MPSRNENEQRELIEIVFRQFVRLAKTRLKRGERKKKPNFRKLASSRNLVENGMRIDGEKREKKRARDYFTLYDIMHIAKSVSAMAMAWYLSMKMH